VRRLRPADIEHMIFPIHEAVLGKALLECIYDLARFKLLG
jgi:hypothetical protein